MPRTSKDQRQEISARIDKRQLALGHWLNTQGYGIPTLEVASADASTRRYFRFSHGNQSLIAVDTPQPEAENQAFVELGQALSHAGLRTPCIYQCDTRAGWMVLEDFGSQTFAATLLTQKDNTAHYTQALDLITAMQGAQSLQQLSTTMTPYSPSMVVRELDIFPQWCLERHLGLSLDAEDKKNLASLSTGLSNAFQEQPQTFVHRDFHSRNLMVLNDGTLGLIDFQGAVSGPITYDWVSLLRDCYTALPREQLQALMAQHVEQTKQKGLCTHSHKQLSRWFDLTGLQRHLKAIGIFCRLAHRDQKPGYLADIPRTFNYVATVAEQHTELAPLKCLIERHKLREKLC